MKNHTTGGLGVVGAVGGASGISKGGIRLNVNVGASNIEVAERFKKKDLEIQEKNMKEISSPIVPKKSKQK